MGAHKGQNNFKAAQTLSVESRKLLISHVLSSTKKGLSFRTVNALVVYIAERTKMHRTTIARNHEYMQLILDCFARQSGSVELISDNEADAPTLRAKLLACRTRVKNIEMENQRLKIAIRLATGTSAKVPERSEEDTHTSYDVSFTNTSMALLLILEHLHEKDLGIKLDISRNQIIDITEVGDNRIIAGPQRLRSFFHWLSVTAPILESEMKLLSSKADVK